MVADESAELVGPLRDPRPAAPFAAAVPGGLAPLGALADVDAATLPTGTARVGGGAGGCADGGRRTPCASKSGASADGRAMGEGGAGPTGSWKGGCANLSKNDRGYRII